MNKHRELVRTGKNEYEQKIFRNGKKLISIENLPVPVENK